MNTQNRCFTITFLTITVLLSHSAAAAPTVKPLPFSPAQVTPEMKYPGKLVGGLRWQDRVGDNLLLFSRKRSTRRRGGGQDPLHAVWLHAHHYALRGDKLKLLRRVRDQEGRCEFDLSAEFVKASLAVTDLDSDGIGEVSFAYKLGCRSDVSPITLKLLLLEGGKKYILRGTTRVKLSATESLGGGHKIDRSFKRGPKVFLRHARQLWTKIVQEF